MTETVPETVSVSRMVPKMVKKTRTVQKTEMVPKVVEQEEDYFEDEMQEIAVRVVEMVPEERVMTIMVPEQRTETVMVPVGVTMETVSEPQTVSRVEKIPRTVIDTIFEPQPVTRTEMVPQTTTTIVGVPQTRTTMRAVPRTVIDTEEYEHEVKSTLCEPKCVTEAFEETKVIRFDPLSGQQLNCNGGGGSPLPRAPVAFPPPQLGTPQRMRPVASEIGTACDSQDQLMMLTQQMQSLAAGQKSLTQAIAHLTGRGASPIPCPPVQRPSYMPTTTA